MVNFVSTGQQWQTLIEELNAFLRESRQQVDTQISGETVSIKRRIKKGNTPCTRFLISYGFRGTKKWITVFSYVENFSLTSAKLYIGGPCTNMAKLLKFHRDQRNRNGSLHEHKHFSVNVNAMRWFLKLFPLSFVLFWSFCTEVGVSSQPSGNIFQFALTGI